MKYVINVVIILFFSALHAQVFIPEQKQSNSLNKIYPRALSTLDHTTIKPKELAIHYFTNLARMGYNCDTPSLTCSDSSNLPLLMLEFNLSTAARWFSQHLHDTPCFQHDTCCELEKHNNSVQCKTGTLCNSSTCDKSNCSGTDWATRTQMFGSSPNAENIAGGNSSAKGTLCQWMNSSGHRQNICRDSLTSLGVGYYNGDECYKNYWTQDFGMQSQTTHIYSGAIFSDNGLKAGVIVDGSSAVTNAYVYINGEKAVLSRTIGTSTRGAFSADVSLSACDSYYFEVTFDDSTTARFPQNGNFYYSQLPENCENNEIPDESVDNTFEQPDYGSAEDRHSNNENIIYESDNYSNNTGCSCSLL